MKNLLKASLKFTLILLLNLLFYSCGNNSKLDPRDNIESFNLEGEIVAFHYFLCDTPKSEAKGFRYNLGLGNLSIRTKDSIINLMFNTSQIDTIAVLNKIINKPSIGAYSLNENILYKSVKIKFTKKDVTILSEKDKSLPINNKIELCTILSFDTIKNVIKNETFQTVISDTTKYLFRPVGLGVHFDNPQSARVNCFLNKQDSMLVLGRFNLINWNERENTEFGTKVGHIAGIDGKSWFAMPKLSCRGQIRSAIYYKNVLYVGGSFYDTNIRGLASLNGDLWVAPGGKYFNNDDVSMSNGIYSMTIFNGELYVGGYFSILCDDGTYANNIAKWDGEKWHAVSEFKIKDKMLMEKDPNLRGYKVCNGLSDAGFVSALCVYNNQLYAGGNFRFADGRIVNNICAWDGKTWNSLDMGLNNEVNTMIEFNKELWVGGKFTNASGIKTKFLAKWTGKGWKGCGVNFDQNETSRVTCFTQHENRLYIGGSFQYLLPEGINKNLIAFDGNNFIGLPIDFEGKNGLNPPFCLNSFKGALYYGNQDGNSFGIRSGFNSIIKLVKLK